MFRITLALFTAAAFAQQPPDLRLPGDVRPIRYDVELRLDPAAAGYSGRVGIDAEVKTATNVVWLHSRQLKISRAAIGKADAKVVQSGDFLGLASTDPISPGRVRIEIEFEGEYNARDTEGLFKQTDPMGEPYLFTQFEATSARRAFPCFDEPGFKVPWKVTLRVPAKTGAFANTPVRAEKNGGDGTRVVQFAESKPMPSYLVAFAVGPFDVVEGPAAGRNKIRTRVLAPKGRGQDTAFTNEVTPKIVAALERYFGVPYPFEKLDQVTIPITVGFGAMENAGLITYQQNLLLATKDTETIARRRSSAEVIAHEVAHQWFGNMVTMQWWDDIWLNEAFATWMADKIVIELFPEWKNEVAAVSSAMNVMDNDSMVTARRVRQPIQTHADISMAFDGITYQKGGAVIRMFEGYVGAERFRRGVQSYIRKYAWRNATASEFLREIGAASGRDITREFSQYLDRPGVPLLTVELDCTAKPSLNVTQQRSLPVGSKGDRNQYWPVPVCVRYESGGKVSRECVMVSDPKDRIALKAATSCPAWVNANADAAGYYQVLYKGELLNKLAANSKNLGLHEKVGLLNQTLVLMNAGLMPAGDAVALAREFHPGPERELILASLAVLRGVRKFMPASLQEAHAQMVREWFGPKARELGWEPRPGEDEDSRLLRPEVVGSVATAGRDPELLRQARELAERWLRDRKSVNAEVAGRVLRAAAQYGDHAFFERLVAEARKTRDRRERSLLVDAVGVISDPAIARDALKLILDPGLDVREWSRLLYQYRATPETQLLPWQFAMENYDALSKRLPSIFELSPETLLIYTGQGFCDAAGRKKVEERFGERAKAIPGGARALAITLESIDLCSAVREVQEPEVVKLLRR